MAEQTQTNGHTELEDAPTQALQPAKVEDPPAGLPQPRASNAGLAPALGVRHLVPVLGVLFALIALAFFLIRRAPAAPTLFQARRFTSNFDEDNVTAVGLTPDGAIVAYADADGVQLRNASGGPAHLLAGLPVRNISHISWFPDQTHLVVSGDGPAAGKEQVWKISTLSEQAVLMGSDARLGEVSHDGSSVSFTSSDGSEIRVAGSAGEHLHKLTSIPSGDRINLLLWSPDDRSLFIQRSADAAANSAPFAPSVFRDTFERIDLRSGRADESRTDLSMGDACVTPGGKILYTDSESGQSQEARTLQERSIGASGGLGSTVSTCFKQETTPTCMALAARPMANG